MHILNVRIVPRQMQNVAHARRQNASGRRHGPEAYAVIAARRQQIVGRWAALHVWREKNKLV